MLLFFVLKKDQVFHDLLQICQLSAMPRCRSESLRISLSSPCCCNASISTILQTSLELFISMTRILLTWLSFHVIINIDWLIDLKNKSIFIFRLFDSLHLIPAKTGNRIISVFEPKLNQTLISETKTGKKLNNMRLINCPTWTIVQPGHLCAWVVVLALD